MQRHRKQIRRGFGVADLALAHHRAGLRQSRTLIHTRVRIERQPIEFARHRLAGQLENALSGTAVAHRSQFQGTAVKRYGFVERAF